MDIAETVGRARRAGTPLIAISTPDAAHTVNIISNWHMSNNMANTAIVVWDIANGYTAYNDLGQEAIAKIAKTAAVKNPVEMLAQIGATGKVGVGDEGMLIGQNVIVFMHMAHRFMDSAQTLQGIWNLRDTYKNHRCTLIMLGSRIKLPVELTNDVLLIEEELPDDKKLMQIVKDVYSFSEIDQPDEPYLNQCVDGVRGLSAFIAEQNLAMSMRREGIDLAFLWSLKKSSIENIPGIQFHYGGDMTLADMGGNEAIVELINGVFTGRNKPRVVVWVDEIEKSFAGASGPMKESSGTSADALGVVLKYMEDHNATGVILVGLAGTGKTMTARGAGSTYRVPTLEVDINGTKDSLVGSSEQRIRNVIRTVDGMSGDGGAFFIATSNNLSALPPELKRRFRLGIYYFDLPTPEERSIIWDIQRRKYEIDPADELPDDTDWTGADIRNCCEIAWSLNFTLKKAATRLSPIAKTDPDKVEELRRQADGHFLSSSYEGIWTQERRTTRAVQSKQRRMVEV